MQGILDCLPVRLFFAVITRTQILVRPICAQISADNLFVCVLTMATRRQHVIVSAILTYRKLLAYINTHLTQRNQTNCERIHLGTSAQICKNIILITDGQ